MITWKQWIINASKNINNSYCPKLDAEVLLKSVVGISYAKILAFGETKLTNDQYLKLNSLLIRRKNGEPMAYIMGHKEFWSIIIDVSKETLIPRASTECLVEEILRLPLPYEAKVLDLGTGTGAISLALGKERSKWKITGIDNKLGALSIAKINKTKLGINNVTFKYGNLCVFEKKKFDLIVSNPPYIDINDHCLNKGDLRFEPISALVADDNGLAFLSIITKKASYYLNINGWLMLEHGYNQGLTVRLLLNNARFSDVTTKIDYHKKERFSLGRKK